MKFFAETQQKRIITLYDSDAEAVSKLRPSILYKWEVTKTRNPTAHKRFFALLNLGYQNQDVHKNFGDYRELKIMQAGYYRTIPTSKGVIYRPMSVSYESMDDLEFEELRKALIVILCKDLHSKPEIIEKELINFM